MFFSDPKKLCVAMSGVLLSACGGGFTVTIEPTTTAGTESTTTVVVKVPTTTVPPTTTPPPVVVVPDPVVVLATNAMPIANAGLDLTGFRGQAITLSGTGSSDPEAATLTYTWDWASRPIGSLAVLTGNTTASPSFTPDLVGRYEIKLVVNDGQDNSLLDVVAVEVSNRAPVANAGSDKFVNNGDTVNVSGTNSADPDGDPLTYQWRIVAKPTGSNAVLANDKLALFSFKPDAAGQYELELVVNDGKVSSTADKMAVTALAPTIGTTVTTVKVEATSSTNQTNVPVTFGQVFAKGDIATGKTLVARTSTGTSIPLQVDAKATHADGSLRHAVFTAMLPSLAASKTETLELVSASASTASTGPVLSDVLNTNFDTVVSLNVGGTSYSASARNLLQTTQAKMWLDGSLTKEWEVSAPFKTSSGTAHPHLTARFSIRAYKGLESIWVSAVVENNWTFEPGSQNFIYDVSVTSSGQEVFSKLGLTHYHHARWRKEFWWGKQPSVHVKHDTKYLIATKAVPNYDQSLVVPETALAGLATALTADKVGPMTIGLAHLYMPETGGRQDIGSLPRWSVLYLLSMDKRAKNAMLATADGAGSWPIHYRDKATNLPVRLDQDTDYDLRVGATNKWISTHSNFNNSGPLPVPRCANNDITLCKTPMTPDTAHQPSLVYLPYLVTGDHYYLEELQFWSVWNPLGTSPEYRGHEKGLFKFDQVRSQAWSLRTLAHNAFIAPDNDPLKKYFSDQVQYNADDYTQTYVNNTSANKLGFLNYISDAGTNKPWMDDFFTWATNYAVELGYETYRPLLQWKSKYPVGRMTAPGYCWIVGGVYEMKLAEPTSRNTPYETFKQAYDATLSWQNGGLDTAMITMPCAGSEMATHLKLKVGEMTGYSGSPTGFPSNMQPALAAAVDSGIVNASQAWTIFMSRTVKPDYSSEPQFSIIPR